MSDFRAMKWLPKYLRYVDYIAAASLYLKDNFLLEEPLKPEHIKERILGHWGTVPGLSFIYAHANYLIKKHDIEALFVTGPGHGAPAILANLFAEKSITKFYKEYPLNGKGMGKLIRDFSWPHTPFPSHVTPTVPGSILEGGELGYSLSTAFGAVLDNPNLISIVAVGDGEAETGPIATAWHSNKFLNPKTSGAVLPIIHINGYKISNPTIYGRMSNDELMALFYGYGYEPIIVEGWRMHKKMAKAMEHAYKKIRQIQRQAREKGQCPKRPQWPVILLRSPKGWHGIDEFKGHAVEGSFHAHGIPVSKLKTDPEALAAVEKWLRSYKIHKLVDEKGAPKPEILRFVPAGKKAMGMNKHAIGGNMMKPLKFPAMSKYAMKVTDKNRGYLKAGSTTEAGKMIRDMFKKNPKNFRVFCPDELLSNKFGAVFEQTKRAFMWPLDENDEQMSPDGRVMEMLSEHTLQGWMSAYLLTGRHGMFVSYEAFTGIVATMVDQYAKFLKQAKRVPWRKPVGSAVYVNSSVGWRQDHNGYSHQNPSFVSSVLQKHGEFCQVYYPVDANSLLVAFEEAFKQKDSICVIVAGKRPLPQWLSLKEAREQAKTGIGIWEWATSKKEAAKPDVVLASAGDYITQEAMCAIKLCKELIPEMKIRYVNVSELTSMGLGDRFCKGKKVCATEVGVNKYFTKDKPVVFAYHGYVNDIEQILWPYASSHRFALHGYREEGSTTTPFDMLVSNEISAYHLAMSMIAQFAKNNKKAAAKCAKIRKTLQGRINAHQRYIKQYGTDPAEVENLKW